MLKNGSVIDVYFTVKHSDLGTPSEHNKRLVRTQLLICQGLLKSQILSVYFLGVSSASSASYQYHELKNCIQIQVRQQQVGKHVFMSKKLLLYVISTSTNEN